MSKHSSPTHSSFMILEVVSSLPSKLTVTSSSSCKDTSTIFLCGSSYKRFSAAERSGYPIVHLHFTANLRNIQPIPTVCNGALTSMSFFQFAANKSVLKNPHARRSLPSDQSECPPLLRSPISSFSSHSWV